ncbi:RNA polymerase factor sigma-54 [Paraburkholderia caballeronis]|uniref:RNA polymerase sigma-54 factor n=1 Tax=Paraburkholderia caballeronis TaxID=416943 RepID=A0A1H7J5I0_9BURK|nr:RNA polymerase factor sigma-54 [Paraburkholderia caballeronis]PXW27555.1 RNA polymerase RpoN-/SigL-like sigma 54 subunit [Paraburkholderia caballeronis]PXX03029.1 RNA polymerase RpoN-/SigL-like sigma 54 subunit [Paraburkholderia caballeronis]RAK03754.1 RNA polymerase RpoN-/SigL-like sigma 54 subunit [Paraburkholderia caballeronis]SEC21589.1 RNA polymerase, sigma 54 subunit, RpoN/SigL [Paraburkholderia caballeronis]SEK69928.1 RNA polymerase, sigma 54 subunit, RpoN/SigL [Paraburkholderia caba
MPPPTLALHTRQHLALTPRLQQAVRLLQLSALEFQQELREALETNPFLEYAPPSQDEAAGPGESAAPPSDTAAEPATDDGALTRDASDTLSDALPDDGGYAEPADMPLRPSGSPSGTRDNDDFAADPADWTSAQLTLHEQLHASLRLSRLQGRDRVAASVVIEALDDDGYLRQDLADLAPVADMMPPLTEAELRVALRVVQSLDRPGIGARSLGECLALQLDALPASTPGRDLAREMVTHHLERLARREHGELQRHLGCDPEALRVATALVRRLDPRPGNEYGRTDGGYVIPDVIVRQVRNRLVVAINPAVMPRARIHSLYAELYAQSGDGARSPLAQQLQEARWLIRNAHKRCQTILRVGECIVARQKAFFQYGEIALRPLQLRDVADELGLHESTISRATGNKYMATPRGTFEFKRFFPRELETQSGGTCSAAAVRALITEMIAAEDRREPLSDVVLTRMLAEQGVVVARRTVTKYRQSMKVPPAELRRQ